MYTCSNCNKTFSTELALELHEDSCAEGDLLCRQCGERFREGEATRDGWHYECPSEGCDGSGRGEDIVEVADARIAKRV